MEGIDQTKQFLVIPDRKTAIEAALSFANKGDIVLITGRGHEQFQLFANGKKKLSLTIMKLQQNV